MTIFFTRSLKCKKKKTNLIQIEIWKRNCVVEIRITRDVPICILKGILWNMNKKFSIDQKQGEGQV